ncbi:MAG: LytR family transcriptional regulator [Tissierellia bacterium]|nr:LytR family transcriptional regulator [Tissierellia bacterium]
MKTFWKVFIVSFISFFFAISLGSYTYILESRHKMNSKVAEIENEDEVEDKALKKPQVYTSLPEAFKKNNRVNVAVLGMEDVRADTIMLASFSPETKKVDVISIPRDTYIHRKGYDGAEQRKINSIYGEHGIEGIKKAISHILEGVPIHHSVMIDYEGVINIIDSIGGVDVVVPFDMKYQDPTSTPPLNIDIKKGSQTLDGKKSLDFLRYRKGNGRETGYIDGDLGRIKAQQQFLTSFVNKTLSYRLPIVIKNSFNHIKTDITLKEALSYGKNAIGIKSDNFSFIMLPGEAEFKRFNGKLLSYYIHDPLEVKKVLYEIYGVKKTP